MVKRLKMISENVWVNDNVGVVVVKVTGLARCAPDMSMLKFTEVKVSSHLLY